MRAVLSGVFVLALLVVCAAQVSGADGEPQWVETFGGSHGVDDEVRALAVHDDGSGPALYVAGAFDQADGIEARGIARWDGSAFSALGDGLTAPASCLAVFDDGGGPALYVGGAFGLAGGVPAQAVARWDGGSWSAVGPTTPGPFGEVHALAVFDDGGGPALYAGGAFTELGGVPAHCIARWDGTSWSALGAGVSAAGEQAAVRALAVFDDGSGPALYVGGVFDAAGGVPCQRIARWDGSAWSGLGGGMSGPPGDAFDNGVYALAVYDDGVGPALVAGGSFETAGGASANHVARWDGSSWSALGSGTSTASTTRVAALAVYDDGSGPALYAGGRFAVAGGVEVGDIARWDGSSWSALQTGLESPGLNAVLAFSVLDHGGGSQLVVGGDITGVSGVVAPNLARWNGSWSGLGSGPGLDGDVRALASFDGGGGERLYAAGEFMHAGGEPTSHVAAWDGAGWSAMGTGVNGDVAALAVFGEGASRALYVGGTFNSAGGALAFNLARWDGTSWAALLSDFGLGAGTNGPVHALGTFDDGGGDDLYVGGAFTHGGFTPASNVARWDGSSWSALGSGTNGPVRGFVVHDDGSGEALYAGGDFLSAGGAPGTARVARWDGAGWSGLDGGALDGSVLSLAVFDGGGGPALFVGGSFTSIGGVAAAHVARWDGSAWSPLGSGTSTTWISGTADVHAVLVFDDGGGPDLYAGGWFTHAGGVLSERLARWDGSSWSRPSRQPFPVGVGSAGIVRALTAFDDGSGSDLYAGGGRYAFHTAGDAYLARLDGGAPPPWADLGGGTSGVAGPPRLELSGPLTPDSLVSVALADGAPSALALLFLSFASTPAPFVGGTLHALPFSQLFVLGTDPDGELHGAALFPGAPSGTGLWIQVALQDASVPLHGASLSNAVKGTVP